MPEIQPGQVVRVTTLPVLSVFGTWAFGIELIGRFNGIENGLAVFEDKEKGWELRCDEASLARILPMA